MKNRVLAGALVGILVLVFSFKMIVGTAFGWNEVSGKQEIQVADVQDGSLFVLKTRSPLTLTLTADEPFFVKGRFIFLQSRYEYEDGKHHIGPSRIASGQTLDMRITTYSDTSNVTFITDGTGVIIDNQKEKNEIVLLIIIVLLGGIVGGYLGFISWVDSPAGKRSTLE